MCFACRLFGDDSTSLSVDVDSTCRSGSRCAGCYHPFSAGDLVMRLHPAVFHSSCFCCCVCRRRLSRGQQFALVDSCRIYCRTDYERRHTGPAFAEASPGLDARRLVFDGERESRPCDDDVGPATNTDDDTVSPINCAVRTVYRAGRRARKLTPCVFQNSRTSTLSCNFHCCYQHVLCIFCI